MHTEGFTVSVVDSGTEALVIVSGELDARTCQQLASRLEPVVASGDGDVVVDLGQVDFADSTAVHLLTRVGLELLADGRRLLVRSASVPLARLLSLTDLLDWFAPRE